jgi:hypothetical protein
MSAALINLTAEKESASVILDTRRTRPRFFDGKFLTAADLTQEQSYLLTRQADLGRTLGFGVVAGLRVTRASRSASGLPNPAASVTVGRGHGLTPAGDLVFLPHEVTIDLGNVAQMQRLSAAFGLTREPQPPFQNLRGLYVLGLRAVEFTANPTPAYPPSVDGNSALRDGEVIEATALTLVPYDSDASRQDAEAARSRAAREIFLEQKIAPLPAGVLPLALLYVRHGALEWIDEWLVRREAGDDDRFGFGFAPRALSEAHFFHYRERVAGAPMAAAGQLAARSFLEIIPPAGPLPAGVLNPADFTQAYFPAEARVELALVPEDELAALMEDSIDLPPIDLNLRPEDQDALAILVLAPVPRADFGNILQTLARTPQPALRNPLPPLLSQQKPIQALLKLNESFLLRRGDVVAPADTTPADFIDPAWREALRRVGQLWYLRRRNFPDGRDLAGTPLRVSPEVVRPSLPIRPDLPVLTPSLPSISTVPATPAAPAAPSAPATPTSTDTPPAPTTTTTPVPTPTPAAPTTPTTPATPAVTTTPTPTTPVTPAVPTTPTTTLPTRPVVTNPVVDPVPTRPVVTPVVTSPVVTNPVVTNPVVTSPVATNPVVTSPVVVRPTSPTLVTPIRRPAAETAALGAAEQTLAEQLNAEGLWGRFAFLRAISDAPTHAVLVELLQSPLVAKLPLLLHAIIAALEQAIPGVSDQPEENFAQIQKGANLKVLTAAIVADVERELVNEDVGRGLRAAAKGHPKLLSDLRHRRTLGRTHRVGALAQIGLKHTAHEEFAKLMTAVEKNAATGRTQAVTDALDRFLKKVNA